MASLLARATAGGAAGAADAARLVGGELPRAATSPRALRDLVLGRAGDDLVAVRWAHLALRPQAMPEAARAELRALGTRRPRVGVDPALTLFVGFLSWEEPRLRRRLVRDAARGPRRVRELARLLTDALDASATGAPKSLALRRLLRRRRQVTSAGSTASVSAANGPVSARGPRDEAELAASALDALRAGDDFAMAEAVARLRGHPALGVTFRIVDYVDGDGHVQGRHAADELRVEALLALRELGSRSILPWLVARARHDDVRAIDLLGALADARATDDLVALLEPSRATASDRRREAAIVRALAALGAKRAAPRLRALLDENPMRTWREGLEREVLVRALVGALGKLGDVAAAPALLGLLRTKSPEHKPLAPVLCRALGRLGHVAALDDVVALARSPKETLGPELVWALGALGQAAPARRAEVRALLDELTSPDATVEVVREAARAKLGPVDRGVFAAAFQRALDEPAFRRQDTSLRLAWAVEALGEVPAAHLAPRDADRLYVLDDHRARRAAERVLPTLGRPRPALRRYYRFVLPELEAERGLEGLHAALEDEDGLFRHNVAERLGELGDPRSVAPLARHVERLLGAQPASTYEYDDAPPALVLWVRALARFRATRGDRVLLEALRHGHHQARAIVAEHPPRTRAFVPELERLLVDPSSFLRSRAELGLASLADLDADAPAAADVASLLHDRA